VDLHLDGRHGMFPAVLVLHGHYIPGLIQDPSECEVEEAGIGPDDQFLSALVAPDELFPVGHDWSPFTGKQKGRYDGYGRHIDLLVFLSEYPG
jgi:hypothetical protein